MEGGVHLPVSPHPEMEREIPFLCPRSPLSSVSWRLCEGPVHPGHRAEGNASPEPSSPPAPSPAGSPGAPGTDCGPSSSARLPRLSRGSARQAQLAAMGTRAAQPLSPAVTGSARSVPSLFFPGRARRAGTLKPWKRHGPPVPLQLSSLPGRFLRLCRPPGLLALPQLGPGPSPPPTLGPQLGQCRESQGLSGTPGSPRLLPSRIRCRLRGPLLRLRVPPSPVTHPWGSGRGPAQGSTL